MKGFIESIRSLLKAVLVTCELLIGSFAVFLMVQSVRENDWAKVVFLYIFVAALAFAGYCLGWLIAIGKDVSFSFMLKGLIVAPLFLIYLIYKQIRSPYLLKSQGGKASATVKKKASPQANKDGDGRKKDPLRGELRSKLARVKNNFNYTSGYIQVTCRHSGPLVQYNPPNRIGAYNITLNYTVETNEDGELFEYIDIGRFMEDTERSVKESIRSQVDSILKELHEKYNNYDDVEFTPGPYWVTSAAPQYKSCRKR